MTPLVAALAVVLLARPGRRPVRVAAPPDRAALPRVAALAAGLLVGLVGAHVLGTAGWLLAAPVALLLPARLEPVLTARPGPLPVAGVRAALGLDLLAAGLDAGLPPSSAARTAGQVLLATDPALAALLEAAGAALAIGVPPAAAWAGLEAPGLPAALRAAGRALARADASGTRVAPTLRRQADTARDDAAGVRQARAQRLAVTTTVPLGLCFLPAFLLLGVAPVALTLLGTLRR